jgi:Tfp pilus assembly protein PilZ
MQERRKFARKPLAASLEIYSKDQGKSLGKGFVTNLGEGGVALETHKNLRLGEQLMLRFTLPDEKTYSLAGEIVYAQDGVLTKAYGARFCETPPAPAHSELKHFVAKQRK